MGWTLNLLGGKWNSKQRLAQTWPHRPLQELELSSEGNKEPQRAFKQEIP